MQSKEWLVVGECRRNERDREERREIKPLCTQGAFSVAAFLGSVSHLLYEFRALKVVVDDADSDDRKDRCHGSCVLRDG